RTPECVGAGVDGILQEAKNRIVERQAPHDSVSLHRILLEHGQLNRLESKPKEHLAHASKLDEPPEDKTDRLLNPSVGVFLDPSVARFHIADRKTQNQLAAPSLGEKTLVGTLADPAELCLADRSFEPQQQSIVELTKIVDAFSVDNQSVHQSTEI